MRLNKQLDREIGKSPDERLVEASMPKRQKFKERSDHIRSLQREHSKRRQVQQLIFGYKLAKQQEYSSSQLHAKAHEFKEKIKF